MSEPGSLPGVLGGESGGGLTRADNRVRSAVARHLNLVWRVLRRSGLEPADAEDAAQDVFWVLAQRLSDVPQRAERSFLVSTALRVARDVRRSKWRRSVSERLDLETRAGDSPGPDRALELRRARAMLDRALELLADTERAVFVLAEIEQMTRAEVSDALGIPEGTVASRLTRARQSFEAALRRLRSQSRTRG